MKDELVPPRHTIELHDAAEEAKFKSIHTVQNGGHNVSYYVPILRSLSRYAVFFSAAI